MRRIMRPSADDAGQPAPGGEAAAPDATAPIGEPNPGANPFARPAPEGAEQPAQDAEQPAQDAEQPAQDAEQPAQVEQPVDGAEPAAPADDGAARRGAADAGAARRRRADRRGRSAGRG